MAALSQEQPALVSRGSIFIVEDDHELLDALSTALTEEGYGVESVSTAKQALSKLETGPPPDLILLDLMMPEMTGWEFRVEQRLRPRLADIPLVAMSGTLSAQARAIDASAYLHKPFESHELIGTIERVILQAERARLVAHSSEFERLRSLGLLAAGIAHEVNNPLAFVAGNNELARKLCSDLSRLDIDEWTIELRKLQRYLEYVDEGVERIASVVRSVATFSRSGDAQTVPIDVHEVMTASIRLVSNELRHRARLVLELGAVPSVLGNPSELGQVFLNLLINAVHAIPDGSVDTATVTVTTVCEAHDIVAIEVADSGIGMSSDTLGRIFEPFFTTKPVGRGMGLGLSICRSIVTSMGGTIVVRSTPGRGSLFRIELPGNTTRSSQVDEIARPKAPARNPPRFRHRVLVIDDEPMICDWLDALLMDTCDVSCTTSSRAALERLMAGESFDVILCDLMMPELNGMDFYDEVQSRRKEMVDSIVFMTGGAFTGRASTFLDRMGLRTLRKPFRPHELFAMIEAHAPRGVRAYARQTNS